MIVDLALSPFLFSSLFMYFEIVLLDLFKFRTLVFLVDGTFIMKCSSLALEVTLIDGCICHVSSVS